MTAPPPKQSSSSNEWDDGPNVPFVIDSFRDPPTSRGRGFAVANNGANNGFGNRDDDNNGWLVRCVFLLSVVLSK